MKETEHDKLCTTEERPERQLEEDSVLKNRKSRKPLGSQPLNAWSPGGLHLET